MYLVMRLVLPMVLLCQIQAYIISHLEGRRIVGPSTMMQLKHEGPTPSNFPRKAYLTSIISVLAGAAILNTNAPAISKAATLQKDEYELSFNFSSPIGLSLADFGTRGKYRVYVKKVLDASQAAAKGVRVPALLVSINGNNCEGLPAKSVLTILKQLQVDGKTAVIVFRNPAKFMEDLEKDKTEGDEVSTQLAPASKSREAQVLKVKKVSIPEICNTGAKYGDLLEIKYSTRLEDGTFLDSSGMDRPGRAGDTSLYFVLGQQPAGQFPKGWDLGLVGSCVGESRRIIVPSILAYQKQGLKKRGIPSDANIIYNVELIGINGNNIPR